MNENLLVCTIEGFIDFWVRSQLTTQEEALTHQHAYKETFLRASSIPDSITAFCCYLVSAGALSCWQCDMLRRHKWKGFFLDHYEVVDLVGYDDDSSYYLARDLDTKEYVKLAVVLKDPTKGPPAAYHVASRFE